MCQGSIGTIRKSLIQIVKRLITKRKLISISKSDKLRSGSIEEPGRRIQTNKRNRIIMQKIVSRVWKLRKEYKINLRI